MVDSGRLLLWFGFSLYFYDEPQFWMSHQKLFQKIVINVIQKKTKRWIVIHRHIFLIQFLKLPGLNVLLAEQALAKQ